MNDAGCTFVYEDTSVCKMWHVRAATLRLLVDMLPLSGEMTSCIAPMIMSGVMVSDALHTSKATIIDPRHYRFLERLITPDKHTVINYQEGQSYCTSVHGGSCSRYGCVVTNTRIFARNLTVLSRLFAKLYCIRVLYDITIRRKLQGQRLLFYLSDIVQLSARLSTGLLISSSLMGLPAMLTRQTSQIAISIGTLALFYGESLERTLALWRSIFAMYLTYCMQCSSGAPTSHRWVVSLIALALAAFYRRVGVSGHTAAALHVIRTCLI